MLKKRTVLLLKKKVNKKDKEYSKGRGQTVGVYVGGIFLSHPILDSEPTLEIYLFLCAFPRNK